MATSTSLLDWLLSLLRDPDARAAFQADPEGYLNECGFHDASSADVHDALSLISENDYSHNNHGVHYPPPSHDYHGGSASHYLNSYITNNYTTIEEHNANIDNSVHQNIDTHGGDFH